MITEYDNAHEMLLAWLEQLNAYDPLGEQAASTIRSLLAERDQLQSILNMAGIIVERTAEGIRWSNPLLAERDALRDEVDRLNRGWHEANIALLTERQRARLPDELVERLRRYVYPRDLNVGPAMWASLALEILAWHEQQGGRSDE